MEMLVMEKDKREHLFSINKDEFDVTFFRCGGHGGQNVNKRSTGARIVHKKSGAVGESRTHRTQLRNKKEAFRRLTETIKFKMYIRKRSWEVIHNKDMEKEIEKKVDEQMNEDNIVVEVKQNGKWVKEK
jgi:protein subunit release factor B